MPLKHQTDHDQCPRMQHKQSFVIVVVVIVFVFKTWSKPLKQQADHDQCLAAYAAQAESNLVGDDKWGLFASHPYYQLGWTSFWDESVMMYWIFLIPKIPLKTMVVKKDRNKGLNHIFWQKKKGTIGGVGKLCANFWKFCWRLNATF